MIALTCIGIDLFLYMSLCSFAFAFIFVDEHGQIEKSPEVENAKLRRYQEVTETDFGNFLIGYS